MPLYSINHGVHLQFYTMQQVARISLVNCCLVSPPGITMPPAGLCFTDVIFFVLNVVLSFDNAWTGRNADCCVNTVSDKITITTNLVIVGPVTPEILWLICMGGKSTSAKIHCMLFFKGHSLRGSIIASL